LYLNCHSYYSLRYGTLPVEDLVELAHQHRVKALALTDINNSSGIPDFVKACRNAGIKPIGGMEFREDDVTRYVGIAMNREGMRELNDLRSWHNLNKESLPDRPKKLDNCFIIYPFAHRPKFILKDNEWVGIKMLEIRRLISSEYKNDQKKLVLLHPISFADTDGYTLHRNLRAIDHNTLLSKLNGNQVADPGERFWPGNELREALSDYPKIIQNTIWMTGQCNLEFDFHSIKNKHTFTGNKRDDTQLLTKLALDGMKYRYRKGDKIAQERVSKELDIITKLGFSSYFLIT